MEVEHVADAAVEGALLWNRSESGLNYIARIVEIEGAAVKACHEGTAVESVARVHYVAYLVGDAQSLGHHCGGHQADEVGLDLEIKVVGMGVIEPVARLGGHDAVADVVAAGLVGVGQMVVGEGKCLGKLLLRAVESETLEGLHESAVVVDVVEEAGLLFPPVFHIVLRPRDRLIVLGV